MDETGPPLPLMRRLASRRSHQVEAAAALGGVVAVSDLPNMPADDGWYRGDTATEPLLSRQIRRCIAAIDKTARNATAGPWHVDATGSEGVITDPAGDLVVYHPDGGGGTGIEPADAEHVGVWDPTRALGFVKLATAVLTEHRPEWSTPDVEPRTLGCRTCRVPPDGAWPCPTVRELADFLDVPTAETYDSARGTA